MSVEEKLLEAHVQEDRDRFEAIRESLEKIDVKLDAVRMELAGLKGVWRGARVIGGVTSFVISIVVTLLVSGILSSCN